MPISGVCAASSTSGYWIASMAAGFPAPGITVGYVAHGSTTGVVSVGTPLVVNNIGMTTGCTISNSPRRMWISRNYNTFGYIDTTLNPAEDWTTVATTSVTTATSNSWSQRSILVNRAQTRIWGLASSYTSSYGIYSNTPGVVPAFPITLNPITNLAYTVVTPLYQTGMWVSNSLRTRPYPICSLHSRTHRHTLSATVTRLAGRCLTTRRSSTIRRRRKSLLAPRLAMSRAMRAQHCSPLCGPTTISSSVVWAPG